MTDEQILTMKAEGRLKIDRETGRVWVYHRKNRTWHEKRPDFHPVSGRARFRFDTPDCRRSTVYKNRLLYVYFNGSTNGDRVDHEDCDRTNDDVGNLRTHSPEESNRQGYERWREISLKYFDEWWDYVRFFGEPPPDHAKNLGSVYR